MKNIKKAAFAVFGAVSLMLPMGLGAVAHADQVSLCDNPESKCELDQPISIPLECSYPGEFPSGTCDLAVDKQVSINGGPYAEADTSTDAAQATVGDTVTWKITVSNASTSSQVPRGWLYVKDDLPSGFSLNSYDISSAASGSGSTWGIFPSPPSDVWAVPLRDSDNATTLPATLTFNTTSTSTGLFQNTAFLYKYDVLGCPDGGCVYSDDVSTNDSNDAWVDPSAKPVVLAESTTLTNTGSGTFTTIAAGSLLAATAVSLVLARRGRQTESTR